ncbi:MAG: GSCFA domain-containing protein [Saprospiraceae bacterium]|nr:GSCFA domain-containing protein [Saprospiraceae bacterium]
MITFRTELPPFNSDFFITHQDCLMSIGSCFTENIGIHLQRLKFNSFLNPFGIIYNPISLSNVLHYLLSDRTFSEKDLFLHQEQWHSFMHHGSFSGLEKEATLENINQSLLEARACFSKVNRLLITLGTAKAFIYKETGEIVANCHKLPGQTFERQRLHIRDIAEAFEPILRDLKKRNPDLQVIFTVSPVRHIRDGLVENQRSKAALLIAIQHLCEDMDFVYYFPAYELMMDDLRDYRFYEADMIHPNQIAIDYIWQYFSEAFFDQPTKQLNSKIEDILQAARHRPFRPQSQQHQAFLRKQLEKIAALEKQYPYLNFIQEKAIFSSQLA